MLFAVSPQAAQTAATPQAATPAHMAPPAHKAVHRKPHKQAKQMKAEKQAAATAVVPVAPKAPEAPIWPANDKPAPASVVWDSQGLRIEALNSSLLQILKDVETATGTEIEGVGGDQRIFGIYGPGLARDVLSELLQGSGYNVVMVGDLGQGAPRQIVMSARTSAGDSKATADRSAVTPGDEDSAEGEAEEQMRPPSPVSRPGLGPMGQPRTPQQIQDMQQQQRQQPPSTPPQ
jgi:hypothetical protein